MTGVAPARDPRYDGGMSKFTISHKGGRHGDVTTMGGPAETIAEAIALAESLPSESNVTITDDQGETLSLAQFKIRYGGVSFG